jgi:hypothetical protein
MAAHPLRGGDKTRVGCPFSEFTGFSLMLMDSNKLEAVSQVLNKTCPECNRLWEEYSAVIQKTFRLEERLSHAQARQDDEQMTALTARLASLADSQTRLGQALTEHIGQTPATR